MQTQQSQWFKTVLLPHKTNTLIFPLANGCAFSLRSMFIDRKRFPEGLILKRFYVDGERLVESRHCWIKEKELVKTREFLQLPWSDMRPRKTWDTDLRILGTPKQSYRLAQSKLFAPGDKLIVEVWNPLEKEIRLTFRFYGEIFRDKRKA